MFSYLTCSCVYEEVTCVRLTFTSALGEFSIYILYIHRYVHMGGGGVQLCGAHFLTRGVQSARFYSKVLYIKGA